LGIASDVLVEAERINEPPDWWAVYAGGCTRDQGGLPYHISTDEEIRDMIADWLTSLLEKLPPPVLITIARSTDDGYCPPHQVCIAFFFLSPDNASIRVYFS
jgi:hypothetical protein